LGSVQESTRRVQTRSYDTLHRHQCFHSTHCFLSTKVPEAQELINDFISRFGLAIIFISLIAKTIFDNNSQNRSDVH
jgi:hypothetical protein